MPLKANGSINFISKLNDNITWSLKLKKKKKKTWSPYVALDGLEVTTWTRWASNPSCLAKVQPRLPAHNPPASSPSAHPTCVNQVVSTLYRKNKPALRGGLAVKRVLDVLAEDPSSRSTLMGQPSKVYNTPGTRHEHCSKTYMQAKHPNTWKNKII